MARQEQTNDLFNLTSFLYGGNADYLSQLYAEYEQDPTSVNSQLREFFESLGDDALVVLKNAQGASWQRKDWPIKSSGELISALDGDWADVEKHMTDKLKSKLAEGTAKNSAGQTVSALSEEEIMNAIHDSVRAVMLIRAYRTLGHLNARLDPLQLNKMRKECKDLDPATYGFSAADYDRKIYLDGVLGLEYATLREILNIVNGIYCSTIGVEYMHISDAAQRAWVQEQFEGSSKDIKLSAEEKKAVLTKLVEAEGFEKILDTKYKGTKRFGLDGGETTIPAIQQAVKTAASMGVKEVVIGMAHRGRLNVLAQLDKPHRALFNEFMGGSFKPDDVDGSGDVKYHLGASTDKDVDGKKVHLTLLPNPSHLEIVNPVVIGKTRSKQDQLLGSTRTLDTPVADRSTVMPLIIHGDAAFAGQGVNAELFGLSGLAGYTAAGSVHIIINNQIGFTTNPWCSRSSIYPSDMAKMVEALIIHVNSDDPDASMRAMRIATEFRMRFHKPVVIDLVCYRRYGHNEGDEPNFTQPLMYKAIRGHKTTLDLYGEQLVAEGIVSADQVEAQKKAWHEKMEAEFEAGASYKPNKADWLDGSWAGLRTADNADEQRRGATGVALKTLKEIGRKLVEVPEGFNLHKTVQRFVENRTNMIESGEGLDWATAEALAYGSLLAEGHGVRISGQDVERGTFSQRHSVYTDQETEARYIPLNNIQKGQALYEPVNAMLAEESVCAYEYGYSMNDPQTLVLWEAQFGDFANGAQAVFDQFISAGESKWLRMSGLVCLLPHGYEGQGPEHSSARFERYLQLCAEDNMQVANCTTPANYFHILRRQLKRNFRKPLILMTPKSLLRNKRAVSSLNDMVTDTTFHRLLLDDAQYLKDQPIKLQKDAKIRRVILCTGKVYYDLYEEREKRGIDDVYLIRVEQLYPFPAKALVNVLSRFLNAEIVWCQEEPKNMGAWSFIEPYLAWVLAHIKAKYQRARYTGRPAAASPAVGQGSKHREQIAAFLEDALGS